MTIEQTRLMRLTRRDAMRLIGAGAAGAGFGLTAGCGPGPEPVSDQAPDLTRAAVTFPDGAVVRTLLADVDPAELGTGATLFHEHLAFNFSSPPPEPRAPTRRRPLSPPTRRWSTCWSRSCGWPPSTV